MMICVVGSLDLQTPYDLRDQLPIIAGIEAILVKMNKPLYYNAGIKRSSKDARTPSVLTSISRSSSDSF